MTGDPWEKVHRRASEMIKNRVLVNNETGIWTKQNEKARIRFLADDFIKKLIFA